MPIYGGEDFVQRVNELQNKPTVSSDNLGKLDDIAIDKSKKNKKSFVMILSILVALFIATIIILKIVSSNNEKEELITQEKIIDKELDFEEDSPIQVEKKLDINKIEQEKLPITKKEVEKKEIKRKDPLEITKEDDFKQEIIKDSVIKKEEIKKKEIKKDIKKKTTSRPIVERKIKKNIIKEKKIKNISKPIGYFIQVGAFTKKVSPSLINVIKKYKFSYTTYKVNVKGRLFTKVLIGPYKNRILALDDLTMVRKIVKNPNAFIIRFK